MSQLTSGMVRTGASLNTVLDLSDRHTRALSSRLGGIFNFIIALLALLVGLAQILGAQSINQAVPAPLPSTTVIGRLIQASELNLVARLLFEGVGLAPDRCVASLWGRMDHSAFAEGNVTGSQETCSCFRVGERCRSVHCCRRCRQRRCIAAPTRSVG